MLCIWKKYVSVDFHKLFIWEKTWKYTVIATVHDFSAWVSNSGTTFLVHEITHMLTNQWENETMTTINNNWPPAIYKLIGIISSATTSVQHPPGGWNRSHSASEQPLHTSYRYKYRGIWTRLIEGNEKIWPGCLYSLTKRKYMFYIWTKKCMKLFNVYWKYTE